MRMSKVLFVAMNIFILIMLSSTLLYAKILVVSPHPDDDILMAAGVTARAVARGEEVRVVYITNGDYNGTLTGLARQGEAVTGQNILGITEDQLMFLGYPDGSLLTIFNNYVNSTDRFTSQNGVSATYGNRGIGRIDYHSYRFGAPANYNRTNILIDLVDILTNFQPDHIIVPAEFDSTTDHNIVYQLVRMAATTVSDINAGYVPIIHKTIVWWGSDDIWPNAPDPNMYTAAIPNFSNLAWANRESIDVPLSMQIPNYSSNPKALALDAHRIGQHGVYGIIGKFLHKDEFFWAESVLGANQPPIVNAGQDQTVMQGSGIVHLDGSQSRDPDGLPLTFQWTQRSGTPVQLSNASNATPSFAVPTGLSQNESLSFELVVSNGQFTTIPDSVTVNVFTVQPYTTNIASQATVTASSESPLYGQTAVKVVDGIVDGYPGNPGSSPNDVGYPGDGTREWVTAGEKVGARLNLNWTTPYTVDRVVLHDRINLDDNITNAIITFSDGSSIETGPLNNNGTATEFTFPVKTITGLTITVTGVSGTTYDIGLAEIEVFGAPAGGSQYILATNATPSGTGSVAINPFKSDYYSGELVTLTATPNIGYVFSGWSGDASGMVNPLVLTMSANRVVTANFTAIPGTLAVTPSTGLSASGAPGGPFSPSSITYTLQNTGNTNINWSATSSQSLVTLSSFGGNLAPGATATVTVSISNVATSFAAGVYTDTVTFTNFTNGNGNSSRDVSLTIAQQTVNIAPLATVSASSEESQYSQTAAKAVDGIVDGYPNDGTREWSSVRERVGAWLRLAWSGQYNVNRVVLHDRINLDDNITNATIMFSDGSSIVTGPLNNNGAATEFTFPVKTITGLTMTVTGVSGTTYAIGLAEIEVYGNTAGTSQYTLTTGVSVVGGGSVAVSPHKTGYYTGELATLTATPNTGYTFSGWSGDASGSINPLILTMSANRVVTANFTAIPGTPIPGTLMVTPSPGLSSSGAPGGPFTPSSASYTLQNNGNTAIDWSASATQSWLTLSQENGSLAPGATATITASINSNAATLAIGSYSDTISFINLTNANGNTSRGVSLVIAIQSSNIGPLASVTASSDSPQYSQTADKAVDGVADGYGGNPGDHTREWATNGQTVGAWLNLAWSAPYSVNQIVLYDRPNSADQITSANITFSDGSSIAVGPLNNDGTATTYTFSPRIITGLRMTVNGVSATTQNAGLAEIQVIGILSNLPQ